MTVLIKIVDEKGHDLKHKPSRYDVRCEIEEEVAAYDQYLRTEVEMPLTLWIERAVVGAYLRWRLLDRHT